MKHKVYTKLDIRHLAEVLIARRAYDDAKYSKQTQIKKP
jgi:hypothetical protein